jgi:transcriptional regulator with XRE-family HTH domain
VRREYEHRLLFGELIETISALLRSQGISQRELAARVGRSEAWISRVLNGRENTTVKTVSDLAWALGLRVRPVFVPFADRDESQAAADPEPPQWLTRQNRRAMEDPATAPKLDR